MTYAPLGYPAVADFDLGAALRVALVKRGRRWRAGLFGTYDGFYTEMFALSPAEKEKIEATRDEVRRLGLIATDMETATMLTAGRILGARAASLCLGTVNGLTQSKIDAGRTWRRASATCSKSRSTPSSFPCHEFSEPAMSVADRYFDLLIERLAEVNATQAGAIDRAAEACASSIAADKLVFSFGTGHGALPALEMFPRTGTIVGFRPIVESTMISFHRVWGDMGARQYRFIHAVEGYGKAILRSHHLHPGDSIVLFSHSGVNAVILDIALGAKEKGLTVISGDIAAAFLREPVSALVRQTAVRSRRHCHRHPRKPRRRVDPDRWARSASRREFDQRRHRDRTCDRRCNSGEARAAGHGALRDGQPEHRREGSR